MANGTRSRRLLLIVDRDLDFVEDLRTLLEGERVLSARSLDEAMEIAEGGRVDVAVLGPSFGHEAGVHSAADLLRIDPTIAAVLVSNVVTTRVLKAALQVGLADVVEAPVTLRKLDEALRRAAPPAPAPTRYVLFEDEPELAAAPPPAASVIEAGSSAPANPRPVLEVGAEMVPEPEPVVEAGPESFEEPEPEVEAGAEAVLEPEPAVEAGPELARRRVAGPGLVAAGRPASPAPGPPDEVPDEVPGEIAPIVVGPGVVRGPADLDGGALEEALADVPAWPIPVPDFGEPDWSRSVPLPEEAAASARPASGAPQPESSRASGDTSAPRPAERPLPPTGPPPVAPQEPPVPLEEPPVPLEEPPVPAEEGDRPMPGFTATGEPEDGDAGEAPDDEIGASTVELTVEPIPAPAPAPPEHAAFAPPVQPQFSPLRTPPASSAPPAFLEGAPPLPGTPPPLPEGAPPVPDTPPPLPGGLFGEPEAPDRETGPAEAAKGPVADEGRATASSPARVIDDVFGPERRRRERPEGGGRVIAVMAGKGGSGKTVTAVNLAVALLLAHGKETVALMDADLQFGDVALLLQLDPTVTVADLAAAADDVGAERLDSLMLRHESGLRVLPAPLIPARSSVSAKQVVKVLERLQAAYSYVVVDTSAVFDDTLVEILDLADDVLMVVDMDLPSVKNAKIALDTLRTGDYPMERVRLVVNRVNSKARLDLVELERSLGLRVAASLPSDRLVPQSVNEGIPAIALSPRSKVAKAFRTLASLFLPDRS